MTSRSRPQDADIRYIDQPVREEDYVIPLLLASTSTLVKMAFTYVVGEDKFKGAYAPCYKRESAKADGYNI